MRDKCVRGKGKSGIYGLCATKPTQRADAARLAGLGGYEVEMRQFLDYVLQAYADHGVEELSLGKIRDFLRIRYGGTNDAKAVLGSVADIRKAFVAIQGHLFR
ncbi:type I restriction-modification enzyme R subunit C-terminal domain-containing protein [Palleronia rufa]|uniref:type I restriction-modification enzyme R subunit C-terminal domain-containing protein n=1 Tax=Palleronia rufa TaxID=1530186 RepID=UPI002E10874C